MGSTSVSGSDVELWAVQIGARPGSDYLLLSREPVEGLVEKFKVLQVACPTANVRDAGSQALRSCLVANGVQCSQESR